MFIEVLDKHCEIFIINIVMNIELSSYPVVFISYDEPNKEINLTKLKLLRPDVLVIDGVLGIENAYKQAHQLIKQHYSASTHVIVVNGDNLISDDFFTLSFKFVKTIDLNDNILCFSARNIINGNVNRSNSIKLFPVDKLIQPTNKFLDLNTVASDALINGSPLQAWRNGMREAFKLCYKDGRFVHNLSQLHWRNFDKLWRYLHLGSDVGNGLYAILGARMGCYLSTVSGYDLNVINDFTQLNTLFKTVESYTKNKIIEECNRLGKQLNHPRIQNIFNEIDSKKYKDTVNPPINSDESFILYKYYPPYDVVFITTKANDNLKIVRDKAPNVKVLITDETLHATYIEAAKICDSDYFWVVTENQKIVDNFDFEYSIQFDMPERSRIWCCKTNLTDVGFEYSGVKLLPRNATIHMNTASTDIIKSIAPVEPILQLSNTLN
jgi:hypothetical protein